MMDARAGDEQAVKLAAEKLSAEHDLGPHERAALEQQLRERMSQHDFANAPEQPSEGASAPAAFPSLEKPTSQVPTLAALKSTAQSMNTRDFMIKLRTCAASRGIDVERLLAEAGGKKTAAGGGTIPKPKFCTTLLDAFHTMRIPDVALEALADSYGTGPIARGRHLEVAWCTFVKDLMSLEPSSRTSTERSTILSGFA